MYLESNREIRFPCINSRIINILILLLIDAIFVVPFIILDNFFPFVIADPQTRLSVIQGLVSLVGSVDLISFLLILWYARKDRKKYYKVYIFHFLVLLYFLSYVIKFILFDFEGAPFNLFSALVNTFIALIVMILAIRKISLFVNSGTADDAPNKRLNSRTLTYSLFFTTTLYFFIVKLLRFLVLAIPAIPDTLDLPYIFFILFAPFAYLGFFIFEKFEFTLKEDNISDSTVI